MIKPGTKLKTDCGRRIRVDRLISAGGQGTAYFVTDSRGGKKGVVKVFHQQFTTKETAKRVAHLTQQAFRAECPVLWTPTEPMNRGGVVGHYAPVAPGASLETFLANEPCGFLEHLQLAVALAHAVEVMHARGFAHGDLHAENLLIRRRGTVLELFIIDHDNYATTGMPRPPCVGNNLYMAPELREAMIAGRPAIPSIGTDRFALGALMHEIILLRHVCAGNDGDEVAFQRAMTSGTWLQDPAAVSAPGAELGGYPAGVLNADLARLFRSALSRDPAQRPSAATWEAELGRALRAVYACPGCGGPCVIDASKCACPSCRAPFPPLEMKFRGRTLTLAAGATVVGRKELGGSAKVSARHAVFRRIGPETWIESTGTNGSYRWTGSAWRPFPNNESKLVGKGDRLRLGDVEVTLA